jgi:hypothetical protein
VQHQDSNLLRFVFQQLLDAIAQCCPGIVDFIDQKDLLTPELLLCLVDPLDLLRMGTMFLVKTVIGNTDRKNRAIDIRLDAMRRSASDFTNL